MHIRTLKLALVVCFLSGITVAFAHSAGPDPGYTGAPGEFNCRQCHTSFPLNDGPGSVSIEGVPATYQPGETYTITVRVEHPNRARWGFQMTALTAALAPAGTFSVTEPQRTQIITDSGKSYVQHKTAGTYAGTLGGASWTVNWTAPPAGAGLVDFYAAGNAANNNNADTGDNIYTTFAETAEEIFVPPFEDRTVAAGLSDAPGGAAVAWADYDGDGRQDFLVARSCRDMLYRNTGSGFTEVGESLGLTAADDSRGAAWGDYDGDGRPDLFVATAAGPRLYRNTASGFVDATEAARFPSTAAVTFGAWADYDGDGHVDLLVGYDGGAALLHNEGGTFVDATAGAGLSGITDARVAAWADYDGDGRVDLFVATGSSAMLLRNDAGGTFTDVTADAGLTGAAAAKDAVWADYDGDMHLDLFVATGASVRLFRSDGRGAFTDVTSSAGLAGASGAALAVDDSNGDGRVDVLVNETSGVRLKRYETSTYVDTTEAAGIEQLDGIAATWADYDGDGHVDLFVLSQSELSLWRNPSTAPTLTVRTRTRAGSDALGSIVAASGQLRVLSGGGSTSQAPARAVFSTATASTLDARATFANGLGRQATATTGEGATLTLDEPESAPAIASIAHKVKNGTDKLVVNGTGFATNAEVVEVNGVEMEATKYPKKKRLGDGTSSRITGTDDNFATLVPRGRTVYITTFNPATGIRSAPVGFSRQ